MFFKFNVNFIESLKLEKVNSSSFDPLVYKAINTNPFDFENDSIIIKSYLKKLLITKNFSLALRLIIFIETNVKPRDNKIQNEKFFRSLLDILFQYKVDVEQNKIPSFFDNFLLNQLQIGGSNTSKVYDSLKMMFSKRVNRFVDYKIRSNESCFFSNKARTDEMGVVLSQGTHGLFTWKNHTIFKSVYDLAIYSMLIEELKPDVIIEIGSGKGGSAVWLADMVKVLGLESKIYSYDINKPNFTYPGISFIKFDLYSLNDKINFPESGNWNGSKLIIEDAHVNISTVLNKIDSLVFKGDYLIIEDSDGKQKDLISFLNTTANKYLADQHYLDLFGRNGTSAINSIFKII